jgi:flagellar motor component MotA
MATDFDLPPIDDLITSEEEMSSIWRDYMAAMVQTLTGYLTQYGIFVPKLTTDQRNTIQAPQNGQIIYNTTLNKFQGYENNAWANFI